MIESALDSAVEAVLILAVIVSIYMLGTSSLKSMIRGSAVQGVLLAILPVLFNPDLHGLAIGLVSLLLKAYVIPRMLMTAMQRAAVNREIEPLISFGASVFIGGMLVAISFGLGQQLLMPGASYTDLLVPCAFSLVLLGLLILVSRTKAITQVVGYIVMENGIFIFGLALVKELPFVVELGILLDVLVGVFIMGIVINRISRTFDHIDTHAMTALRD